MKTIVTCIKVYNLRKQGYSNLREWMKDENNTPTCHAQVLADILNNCSDILYK